MTRFTAFLLALGILAACDAGNPLEESTETTTDTTTTTTDDTTTPITSDRTLPPGTTQPTSDSSIVRYEATSTEDGNGGGYARNITYSNTSGEDLFSVDNLAFDGDNSYIRGGTATSQNAVGQLDDNARFRVYEADQSVTDPLTGNVIDTFTYRAIHSRSTSGMSEFAIVRSGSYSTYGFGGFIYQRNATDDTGAARELIIPTSGDAEYLGDYAGVRIFSGATGLNYVSGDAQVLLDFKDFNDEQTGVAVFIYNRRLFDIDGNDITDAYLDAVEADAALLLVRGSDPNGDVTLSNLTPEITPNIADANGEMTSGIGSTYQFQDGTTSEESSGSYYAIIAGENADEIVGIAVTTGDDPRADGVTFQETGGFIVYRQ